MDTTSDILIHHMARNYIRCLADFPAQLLTEHLAVPEGERAALFNGLVSLSALISAVYQYFVDLPIDPSEAPGWSEDNACWKAIEKPIKLLWALGLVGQLASGPGGQELLANKRELDQALKLRSVKGIAEACEVLQSLGLRIDYRDPQANPRAVEYKKCSTVAVSASAGHESLLPALCYYSAFFPIGKNSLPFEIFLRADFRPLLPGYQIHTPHIPLDEDEITRTMESATRELWLEIRHYSDRRYPKLHPYYRLPRLRHLGWIVDFSATGEDYGLWSIFSDDKGLRLRVVLKPKGYHYLLEHIHELSPRYQETFLNHVACQDCTHCGKHLFYQHGDHVHRLCKGPWYYSPYFQPEDLPDIERLIDIHVAHLK